MISDIYCQSKDMTDFLEGKLEPLTLNACLRPLNSWSMLPNLTNKDSTHCMTISPGVIVGYGRSSMKAKVERGVGLINCKLNDISCSEVTSKVTDLMLLLLTLAGTI